MNKAAIEIATAVKDNYVRNYLSSCLQSGISYTIVTDTPDLTVFQESLSKHQVTARRPRLEHLDPAKGLLLFLKAIYTKPGLPSWKFYLLLTNSKLTSFGTLRGELINYYRFITKDYQVTELGKKLLAAYNLI